MDLFDDTLFRVRGPWPGMPAEVGRIPFVSSFFNYLLAAEVTETIVGIAATQTAAGSDFSSRLSRSEYSTVASPPIATSVRFVRTAQPEPDRDRSFQGCQRQAPSTRRWLA